MPTPKSATVTVTTLCDGQIQIRYARSKQHPYGTKGIARIVRWLPDFIQIVEAAFSDILKYTGHRTDLQLTDLTCGGAWHDTWQTDPDHNVCRHCQGRAIDIDSLWFGGVGLITKSSCRNNIQTYLALESLLRLHFGTVLNYRYNAKHVDHWHCDDGTKPVFRRGDLQGKNRTRVLYLQDSSAQIHGIDAGPIDGEWGGVTAKAVGKVLAQLDGVEHDGTAESIATALINGGYQKYCLATALVGLRIVEQP